MLLSGDAWLVHLERRRAPRHIRKTRTFATLFKEGSSKFIDNCAIPKTAQNKELSACVY